MPETLDQTLKRFQTNRENRQLGETHSITAPQQASLSQNLGSPGEYTEQEIAKLLFIAFATRIQHEGRVQLQELFQALPDVINDLAENCHRYEAPPSLEPSNPTYDITLPLSYNIKQPLLGKITDSNIIENASHELRGKFFMVFENEAGEEEYNDPNPDSYVRFRQGKIPSTSERSIDNERYSSNRIEVPENYIKQAAAAVKEGKETGQPTRIVITGREGGNTMEIIQLEENDQGEYYGMGSVFPRLVSEVSANGKLSNTRPPENMRTLAHHNLSIEREKLNSGVTLEVVQNFEQANEPHLIVQARDQNNTLKAIDELPAVDIQYAIRKAERIAQRLSPEGYIVAVQAGGTFNSLHVHIIPCPEGNTIPPVATPREDIGIQRAG